MYVEFKYLVTASSYLLDILKIMSQENMSLIGEYFEKLENIPFFPAHVLHASICSCAYIVCACAYAMSSSGLLNFFLEGSISLDLELAFSVRLEALKTKLPFISTYS